MRIEAEVSQRNFGLSYLWRPLLAPSVSRNHHRDLLNPVQARGASAPSAGPQETGKGGRPIASPGGRRGASTLTDDIGEPFDAFSLHDLNELRLDAPDQLRTLIGQR